MIIYSSKNAIAMSQENQLFQPGDVVRLKSGGPNMTVNEVIDHDQPGGNQYRDGVEIECTWFKDGNNTYKMFRPHLLVKVDQKESE
jgi:uncharacterized protein YodC (DUF2158 family)